MNTYKCLIIDDEDNARQLLKTYLAAIPVIDIAGECADGFEALRAINTIQPDIVFLDIQMPKLSGLEVLEVCDHNPVVVFSTAYEEYAIKAFEMNAADYLLKPYSAKRLEQAVEKAITQVQKTASAAGLAAGVRSQLPETLQRIVVKTGQAIEVIPVDHIQYIKAEDDYVMVYTPKGKFLKQMTLQYLENHLEADSFARVHRSYIVKIQEIARLEPWGKESWVIVLKDRTQIPVSQSGMRNLKTKLGL